MVEETLRTETAARTKGLSSEKTTWTAGQPGAGHAMTLSQVLKDHANPSEKAKVHRLQTDITELNRVLGGGLVPGSLTLIGGDPGIGKSTLLLQVANDLTQRQSQSGPVRVLYVSAEESVEQTALRAARLGVTPEQSEQIHLLSESSVELIVERALALQPELVIVDSIQTVHVAHVESSPGSVSQVRESAARLLVLAKGHGISVILVGHVTKDGQIAGPRVLEHMVDTVLSFEGEPSQNFRMLRALKNRFGATHELGVFRMTELGLEEVTNPSEFFLEERSESQVGSAVHALLEGTRALLCEIQALTSKSHLPVPRRTAIGYDYNRLGLLTAILSRSVRIDLSQSDLYTNIVGGLQINEPAADFAMAAALFSAHTGLPLSKKICFWGELGLSGEARAVSGADQRAKEAVKLGFTDLIFPDRNRELVKATLKNTGTQVRLHPIKNLAELCQKIKTLAPQKVTANEAFDFTL